MPLRKFTLLVLVSSVLIALASTAAAQQSAYQGPWGGWARCEINVSGQGYSDHQTHTWTISSSASTVSGAFRVYPATWSVAGSGSVQRSQGNQSLMAQWATSAQNLSAPLAVFVRASDRQMFIQARHTQTRAPGAVSGYQQVTIDGKPQKPGTISAEAFEWAFPVVEVSRPRPADPATANGSSTPLVNGKVGYMQPAGTQATASCTWQFGEGPAAPAPPPAVASQPTPTPAGSQGSTGSQNSGQSTGGATTCIGAPSGLPPTATSLSTVTLTWAAPAIGAPTSYVIEASSSAGGPANLANFNTGNALTSLIVPDVPAGTYFVRIRALSSCGTSAPSSEEQLIVSTANASTAPSAPRGLALSISGSTVTLTWLAPTTGVVTSYVTQAGNQAGMADLANFDTNSTALTLVASNVPDGSYYVRVYAKNAAGLSAPSNEVLMTLPAPPPSRKLR
jgi:hypothetical protein